MARQIVQRAKSHKLEHQPMFPSALKKHTVTLLHLFISTIRILRIIQVREIYTISRFISITV